MRALLELSRAVAADLAAEFHNDPRGELTAWFHVALEREGMVARLYRREAIESRFESLPGGLARSAIEKLKGIGVQEAKHVAYIRALLAPDSAWPRVAFRETWGRLQGIVVDHIAGANTIVRAIGLIMLELGARSSRERAAARTVAGLGACEFLKFSRTLEITAVESYQRIVALLAALHPQSALPDSFAVHVKILGILRDERVHRDVFHVLYGAFGGEKTRHDSETTELPESVATWPITSPADLNAVCRAILTFHYGVAVPSGAPPHAAMRAAVDYWRWQMANPFRTSYLVECQRQDVFHPQGDILLLGTAGLEDMALEKFRCRVMPSLDSVVSHSRAVQQTREGDSSPSAWQSCGAEQEPDTIA